MAIQYLDTVWKFNGVAFGEDLTEWKRDNGLTWGEVAELTGHYETDGALSGIGRAAYMPSVSGFIAICNLCELNPTAYFELAD